MKNRPWTLKVLILSLIAFASTPLIRNVPNLQLNLFELVTFESLALYSMLCIWKTSRWIFYSLPLTFGFMSYEIYLAVLDPNPLSLLNAGIFFCCQCAWLIMGTWKTFLNPKLRWWLTPQRMILAAPGEIRSLLGNRTDAKIINVSKSGVLLEVHSDFAIEKDFESGKLLDLKFRLNPLAIIQCRTKVIRLEKKDDHYRFGLKINQIKIRSKLQLENYLKVQAIL